MISTSVGVGAGGIIDAATAAVQVEWIDHGVVVPPGVVVPGRGGGARATSALTTDGSVMHGDDSLGEVSSLDIVACQN